MEDKDSERKKTDSYIVYFGDFGEKKRMSRARDSLIDL